jgi:hypothetical protein
MYRLDLSIGIDSVTKIGSIKFSLLLEKCVGLTIKLAIYSQPINCQDIKYTNR